MEKTQIWILRSKLRLFSQHFLQFKQFSWLFPLFHGKWFILYQSTENMIRKSIFLRKIFSTENNFSGNYFPFNQTLTTRKMQNTDGFNDGILLIGNGNFISATEIATEYDCRIFACCWVAGDRISKIRRHRPRIQRQNLRHTFFGGESGGAGGGDGIKIPSPSETELATEISLLMAPELYTEL